MPFPPGRCRRPRAGCRRRRHAAVAGPYQSITPDSVSFPSVPFPSRSRMAWMAVTAQDRSLTPSHSFRVPGRGWRLNGWKPPGPSVSVTKRATVMSGGPRATGRVVRPPAGQQGEVPDPERGDGAGGEAPAQAVGVAGAAVPGPGSLPERVREPPGPPAQPVPAQDRARGPGAGPAPGRQRHPVQRAAVRARLPVRQAAGRVLPGDRPAVRSTTGRRRPDPQGALDPGTMKLATGGGGRTCAGSPRRSSGSPTGPCHGNGRSSRNPSPEVSGWSPMTDTAWPDSGSGHAAEGESGREVRSSSVQRV